MRNCARSCAIVREGERRFRPENGASLSGDAPKAQQEIFEIHWFFRSSNLDFSVESAIRSSGGISVALRAHFRAPPLERVWDTCSNAADQ